MQFVKNTVQPLEMDWTTVEEGMVANATLSSFNYSKDYCFATLVADGKSIRAIIGTKAECPIKDMMDLKGIEVQITFFGTNVREGKTYPKFTVSY